MPGKNNQWEDVDNQGVKRKWKNEANVSEVSIFTIKPFVQLFKLVLFLDK